jgi:S1-C subfamily serine protease
VEAEMRIVRYVVLSLFAVLVISAAGIGIGTIVDYVSLTYWPVGICQSATTRPAIDLPEPLNWTDPIGPPAPVTTAPARTKIRTQVLNPTVRIITASAGPPPLALPSLDKQGWFGVYREENMGELLHNASGTKFKVNGFASGTVVVRDAMGSLILTARHVTKDASVITVQTFEEEEGSTVIKTYEARIVSRFLSETVNVESSTDVALLRAPNLFSVKPATVALLPVEWGEHVISAHCSLGDLPIVTTGIVSQIPSDEDSGGMIRCSAHILPGASGAAMYSKRGDDYYVVGVVIKGKLSSYPMHKFVTWMTQCASLNKVRYLLDRSGGPSAAWDAIP